MSRFKWACLVLLLIPTLAQAQVHAGTWELTLGGTGVSGNKLDGVTAAANVTVGYFVTRDFELSVRQAITFTDIAVSGDLDSSTRLAADYHFNFGDANQWRPYFGVNGGYIFGDTVTDTFEAAPEVGLKWFLRPDAFLFGQLEYQYFFNSGQDSSFSDGQFVFTVGIGLTF